MARQKDRWPELLKLVEQDDGLPVRDDGVGTWTEDKLYFWNRYIDITTRAMAEKPQWEGLTYVDLFAGPGICVLKESGRRLPGSVLIAAHAPKPFRKIIACELKPSLAKACEERLNTAGAGQRSHVVVGDCNKKAQEITDLIPERTLTLAFIDPTGLDANFETIRTLTAGKQVDLLLLFADRMDIVRNVELYARQPQSKLDLVLGPDSDWRNRFSELGAHSVENICKFFADVYKDQLERHLSYKVFGQETLRSATGSTLPINLCFEARARA